MSQALMVLLGMLVVTLVLRLPIGFGMLISGVSYLIFKRQDLGLVAEQVLKALGSAQPAARYPAGRGARFVVAARRLLPDRVMDAAVRRLFTP